MKQSGENDFQNFPNGTSHGLYASLNLLLLYGSLICHCLFERNCALASKNLTCSIKTLGARLICYISNIFKCGLHEDKDLVLSRFPCPAFVVNCCANCLLCLSSAILRFFVPLPRLIVDCTADLCCVRGLTLIEKLVLSDWESSLFVGPVI